MSNTPLRQSGGTLFGLIIGLIIGLGVALGVAVYVTKVPVPFIDRGVLSNASTDKAEAIKNKNWDPNAAFNQNKVEAPAVPAENTATDATTASPSATPSNDPLGELVQQKVAPSDPGTPSVPAAMANVGQVSELVFFVQAGAYGRVQDAETQRAKLALLGVDARVLTEQNNGQTINRVRAGPYRTRSAALETRQRLTEQNIESLVVAVPK